MAKKIDIEAMDFRDFLKQIHPVARALIIAVVSAAIAYASCFGPLALVGVWRNSFLNPGQFVPAVGLVAIQSIAVYAARNFAHKLVVVLSICWLCIGAGLILLLSSPNDFPMSLAIPIVPAVMTVIAGLIALNLRSDAEG